MATFKVWLCVERIDEEADEYEDVDGALPFAAEAEFDTEVAALQYAGALHDRFAPLAAMVAEYEATYLSGGYDIDGEDVRDYENREDDLLEIADLALTTFGRPTRKGEDDEGR